MFRIGPTIVSQLVTKAQRNKAFMDELVAKRDGKLAQKEEIKQVVSELIDANHFIDSSDYVKAKLPLRDGKTTANRVICQVMTNELGMSYRKIKAVSMHANSEKSLILR